MILKKKLIKLMYEYRIALIITIILILIVGVWGLGFMLAGDRLNMHMYGNTLTNSAGQYRIYLLDVFASNLSEKNTPESIIKINKIVVIHQLNKFMKLVKMKITNLFQ